MNIYQVKYIMSLFWKHIPDGSPYNLTSTCSWIDQRKTTHALLQCKQRCVMCFHFPLCCFFNDSMSCNNKVPTSKKNVLPEIKFKYRYWRSFQHKWDTLRRATKNMTLAKYASIAPNFLPIIIIEAYQFVSHYSKL